MAKGNKRSSTGKTPQINQAIQFNRQIQKINKYKKKNRKDLLWTSLRDWSTKRGLINIKKRAIQKVICHFLLPLASSTSSSSASLVSLLPSLSMYERPDGPDTAGALVGDECSRSSLHPASSDSPWLPDMECLSMAEPGLIHCRRSSSGAWMHENNLRLQDGHRN